VGRPLSPAGHMVPTVTGGPLGPACPEIEEGEAGMPLRLYPPHLGRQEVGITFHLRPPHLWEGQTGMFFRLHPPLLGGEETGMLLCLCPPHHGGRETVIPFRLHPRRSARHALAWRCRRDAPAEEGSLWGPGTASPRWLRYGRPVTGCRRPGRRSPSPQWCPWREDSVLLREEPILKDNLNKTVTPKGKSKHSRKTTVRTDAG